MTSIEIEIARRQYANEVLLANQSTRRLDSLSSAVLDMSDIDSVKKIKAALSDAYDNVVAHCAEIEERDDAKGDAPDADYNGDRAAIAREHNAGLKERR